MTTPHSTSSIEQSPVADAPGVTPAVRALAVEGGSRDEIFQRLFRLALSEFSPLAARRDFRSGTLTRSEFRHQPALSREQAAGLIEECLHRPMLNVQCDANRSAELNTHSTGDRKLYSVCAAFTDVPTGEPEGAIGLLLECSAAEAAETARQLSLLCTVAASVCAARPVAAASKGSLSASSNGSELQPMARAAQFSTVQEFAFTLVNSVSNRFLCEQVAFGTVNRQRVTVLAVSGLSDFKATNPGVQLIRQAMEECLDRTDVAGWQSSSRPANADGTADSVFTPGLIHRQWSDQSGSSAVLSVPMTDDGQIIGVLSLRRPGTRPFSIAERTQLEQIGERFSGPVRLIEQASRPVSRQIAASVNRSVKHSMRRGAWGRWVALTLVCSLVGWFACGSTPFRPRCTSRLAPAQTRHFVAPFGARLKAVHVQAGDTVQAGQLLAEFETRELQLELDSLSAELAAREVDVRQALTENDVDTAAVAQAEVEVLRTRAEAVDTRMRRARLVAPADGQIVQCDSRQLTGQVLAQGDPVLQFAPAGQFVLKVHVPDGIAASVTPGQSGVFASAARPDIALPFSIRQINPSAEVVNEANVFVAEADLTTRPDWLKAGMQGTVQIHADQRPIWWVTTHSITDWLRMRFWL